MSGSFLISEIEGMATRMYHCFPYLLPVSLRLSKMILESLYSLTQLVFYALSLVPFGSAEEYRCGAVHGIILNPAATFLQVRLLR